MKHALTILTEPDHDCGLDETSLDELPDFDDFDVSIFLAFEEGALSLFAFMRMALIKAGYNELTSEVGQ